MLERAQQRDDVVIPNARSGKFSANDAAMNTPNPQPVALFDRDV